MAWFRQRVQRFPPPLIIFFFFLWLGKQKRKSSEILRLCSFSSSWVDSLLFLRFAHSIFPQKNRAIRLCGKVSWGLLCWGGCCESRASDCAQSTPSRKALAVLTTRKIAFILFFFWVFMFSFRFIIITRTLDRAIRLAVLLRRRSSSVTLLQSLRLTSPLLHHLLLPPPLTLEERTAVPLVVVVLRILGYQSRTILVRWQTSRRLHRPSYKSLRPRKWNLRTQRKPSPSIIHTLHPVLSSCSFWPCIAPLTLCIHFQQQEKRGLYFRAKKEQKRLALFCFSLLFCWLLFLFVVAVDDVLQFVVVHFCEQKISWKTTLRFYKKHNKKFKILQKKIELSSISSSIEAIIFFLQFFHFFF